jgi:hypothetical protein
MRHLTPRTAPAASLPRPPASRRPGQRSGEGADSALRGLLDDAGRRPDKAPAAPGHLAAGNGEAARATQQACRPPTARNAGAKRQRLSRPAWLS